MRRLFLALLAGSLVSALALAQWFQGGSGPSTDQLFPGPLGEADFGRVIAGEFSGDHELDAVVMDGEEPKLVVAPAVFDNAIGIGEGATSIASLSGVVAGKDLLLVCGTGGLRSFERDSEELEWIATTIFGPESDWVDAVELAVGDLDGEDGQDLAALAAGGDRVLIAFGAGDGSFVEGEPIELVGPPSYALRLLDWSDSADPDGEHEIALLSGWGTAVFGTDGTLLEVLSGGATNLRVTVLADSGSSVQRLAVIGTWAGIDYLRLHGDAGVTSWSSLGPAGVVSAHGADADGDGDSELFLSVSSERKVWMLENQSPATPTFATGSPLKLAFGPSQRDPAWNQAGLALGDFDNDGAVDVLAPAQGGELPLGGGTLPVYGKVCVVGIDTSALAALRVSVSDALFNLSTGVLLLDVHEPQELLASTGGAVTRLELSVWRTPDFGEPTDPEVYHTALHDLPDPEALVPFQLPAGYSIETSLDVYTCVLRQVSVLAGEVVAVGPSRCVVVVSQANLSVLASAGNTQVYAAIGIEPDSIPPLGGIGIGPTVPPTDPGDQPTRGG